MKNLLYIMTGFRQAWNHLFELRNLTVLSYSLMAFVLIYGLKGNSKIEDLNFKLLFLIASMIFLLIFTFCIIEWVSNTKTIESGIYPACIFIFGFSVIIAAILQDINVIVASATLLLVIITAFSVKKSSDSVNSTNEIARKQLKLQNDPIVCMSLKENDVKIQIIDLIIENVGNGIAKNVRFEPNPYGFITMSGDAIGKLYFFRQGIQILAPRQKYIIHLVNFAQKIQEIRQRYNIPPDGPQLSISEAQRFRQIVRTESELEFTVYYENNEGEQSRIVFYFNLCVFWGLRFP